MGRLLVIYFLGARYLHWHCYLDLDLVYSDFEEMYTYVPSDQSLNDLYG